MNSENGRRRLTKNFLWMEDMLINSVLENKKITGPTILVLAFTAAFLFVYKSGVEPAPKHRTREEVVEDQAPSKPKTVKALPSVSAAGDDRDAYLQDKRVYSFSHLKESYRRTCMMQASPTSSCTRLACDDGKVYCVSSYLEISQ